MINICTECLKLNAIDKEKCHYCGAKCEKIANYRFNRYLIEKNKIAKKEKRRKKMDDNGKKNKTKKEKQEYAFECTGCSELFTMDDIIARDIIQHCDKCRAKIKVYSAPKAEERAEKTHQVTA